MKIGDVSKELNIPSSTIRYYEKRGLIPAPTRVSGVREFNNGTVVTLRFIQLCQAAGFSIAEIHTLLDNYTTDSSKKGLWHPQVNTKRAEIREQIDKLEKMDSILCELTKCRCKSIEQCVDLCS